MHENVTWNPGYRAPKGLSANDAYKEIESIRIANRGELSPSDVVDIARDENSCLHAAFEWNDEEAAVKFRLEQARGMLRSFCVQRIESDEKPGRVYQCVRVSKNDDESEAVNSYWTLEAALEDPEQRVRIINNLKRQLHTMRHKFNQISELAAVWRAVDRVASK
jgi:hypothetical protein